MTMKRPLCPLLLGVVARAHGAPDGVKVSSFDWIRLDLYGAPAQPFLSPDKTWCARTADR